MIATWTVYWHLRALYSHIHPVRQTFTHWQQSFGFHPLTETKSHHVLHILVMHKCSNKQQVTSCSLTAVVEYPTEHLLCSLHFFFLLHLSSVSILKIQWTCSCRTKQIELNQCFESSRKSSLLKPKQPDCPWGKHLTSSCCGGAVCRNLEMYLTALWWDYFHQTTHFLSNLSSVHNLVNDEQKPDIRSFFCAVSYSTVKRFDQQSTVGMDTEM